MNFLRSIFFRPSIHLNSVTPGIEQPYYGSIRFKEGKWVFVLNRLGTFHAAYTVIEFGLTRGLKPVYQWGRTWTASNMCRPLPTNKQ
jgi:hypothetical protein